MTSKSIVSWGQQGGPPEAGQGGSHHLDSGGAFPASHTRLRQFGYYYGPAEPAWLPENYLQLQIIQSPSCLSSQLAEHPGASHLPSLGLQRTTRRSVAEPEGASVPPFSNAHTEAWRGDPLRDTQWPLPPALSRGTLGFLTETVAPTLSLFPSHSFTENRYSFSPHLHLVSPTLPLPGLFPATGPSFSSVCPCPAPRRPSSSLSLLCCFLPSGPPQLPPDRFCSPSRWHNQFAHF